MLHALRQADESGSGYIDGASVWRVLFFLRARQSPEVTAAAESISLCDRVSFDDVIRTFSPLIYADDEREIDTLYTNEATIQDSNDAAALRHSILSLLTRTDPSLIDSDDPDLVTVVSRFCLAYDRLRASPSAASPSADTATTVALRSLNGLLATGTGSSEALRRALESCRARVALLRKEELGETSGERAQDSGVEGGVGSAVDVRGSEAVLRAFKDLALHFVTFVLFVVLQLVSTALAWTSPPASLYADGGANTSTRRPAPPRPHTAAVLSTGPDAGSMPGSPADRSVAARWRRVFR